MAKFSNDSATPVAATATSPVRSKKKQDPRTRTEGGGQGFQRDARSELFLLAVTNMVGESTFYESAGKRDARFVELVEKVTRKDPDWVRRFVPYLRSEMNMRSASLVLAAEYVKAGGPDGRSVIASALARADEPAEMIGYWIGHHGKAVPKPVKRGVADAVTRLYDERAALKYDGDKGVRMGDVVEIVHPSPSAPWQGHLFEYLISKRHGRDRLDLEALPTIAARAALEEVPQDDRRARLAEGLPDGTTWEWASSWVGGKLDGAFWDALIPRMGLFALVRNLRNFDDAGISSDSVEIVRAKLRSADDVKASRMFPLRFYAAHREVATTRWSEALDEAVDLSLSNIPKLPGRTLILVDVSGSMNHPLSDRSKLSRAEAAAVFGSALTLASEKADLVAYNDSSWKVQYRSPGSVVRLSETIVSGVGGGTQTFAAIQASLLPDHDRVVILTDEQAFSHRGNVESIIGARPTYTFNLAGYKTGHLPSGVPNRHVFGGLTDAGFAMIPLLERGETAGWPF